MGEGGGYAAISGVSNCWSAAAAGSGRLAKGKGKRCVASEGKAEVAGGAAAGAYI